MGGFSLLLSFISVLIPVLSAELLVKLTGNLLDELVRVALFIFIVEMSRNLISFVMNRISRAYMIETVTEVQIEMFSETLCIETFEMDKNSSGTFIDRIKGDTQDIINIFSDLVTYFMDLLSNIGILFASFIISPYMFIYFLCTSLILGCIHKKERTLYYERSKKYRQIREKKTSLVVEFIHGIRDVKLLNGKEGILKQTKKEFDIVNKERLTMENTRWNYRLLSSSIRDFFDVTFILFGIYLLSRSLLSISNFLVLHMYRGRIENLLTFYNRFIDLIKDYNLSATRVFEVLGEHFQKENDEGIVLEEVKGKIEFRNVSFSYAENKVLKNVEFTIQPGERVGFVGVSGSGKSTIFNLLTRLYPLQDGNILVDGIDISSISCSSLRNHIALIPQNPYIFNFSVADNLKLANPNISVSQIEKACKSANIYEKIMELENGFDTLLGEGGVSLSGGEKQRLAIARSLVKQSNILLFDEATSSLDNIAQDKVQKAIYALDHNKTILIIAHRLSTVIHCDKIVVIEDGHILDIGSHKELLSRCDYYQKLFQYEEVENY